MLSEDELQRLDALVERGLADATTTTATAADEADISEQLTRALAAAPELARLQTLHYRWQSHLNARYIQAHHLDEFLDGLTQHLLRRKPKRPLDDLLLALDAAAH